MKYFLLYLFLEVLTSVNISSSIGGLATFFEILFSAFVGIMIMVNFRATLMQNIMAISTNTIDLNEFKKINLLITVGAILLIVPGFLTDFIGALMLFSALVKMIINHYNVKSENQRVNNVCSDRQNNKKKDSDVIDVEIISDNPTIK